jgi:CheY-like chemotaxis protein
MTSHRILIVEDKRDAANMYAQALRFFANEDQTTQEGVTSLTGELTIHTACFVAEACRLLEQGPPYDVVIVDLKLPGSSATDMGGLEVIAKAHSVDPLCTVVVITAYGSTELVRESFLLGVYDLVEKNESFLPALLSAVARARAVRQQKLVQVGNPFVPISGREPIVFGGRQAAFDFFEERVSRALQAKVREHFLILGDWGMGKSTLLRQYKKIAQNQGLLASVVVLDPGASEGSQLEVANALVQGILRDVSVPRTRLRGLFGYFESVGISVLGSGFEVSRREDSRRPSPQTLLLDALIHLWDDLREQTELLVILLDDVEHQSSLPDALLILKSVLESERLREAGILVGVASTPGYWTALAKRAEYRHLPRYFRPHVDLDPLSNTDVIATVRGTLRNTGVTFESEVIDLICECVEGHPAKLQLLCYNLFKNQRQGRVSLEGWESALSSTLEELGISLYQPLFEDLEQDDRELLRILVADHEGLTIDQILGDLAGGGWSARNPERTVGRLEILIGKRLLEKNRSRYKVHDRFTAEYIARFV